MNSLLTLIKADFINNYRLNSYKDAKNRKRAVGMTALAIMVILICFLYIGGASLLVSDILISMNLLEILLVFAFALPFFVLLLMNMYKMPSTLFSFKDFDMLMSLPIKENVILTAKIIKLMLSSYIWQFLMSFPIFLVYCIKAQYVSVFTVVVYILLFLILPLLPMSIASASGFLIAKISAKMKSKNLIIILGSFLLLIVIMGISFSIQNIINEQVIINAVQSIANIESSFLLFKLYVDSVARLNILSMLLFALIFITPFILFIYLFGKAFKKINSALMETGASHNVKSIKYEMDSPVIAIFRKELRVYSHCAICVVNTLFGMVLLFLASVAALVMDLNLEAMLSDFGTIGINSQDLKFLLVAILCGFCIMLSSPTSSSISLEGKNLWIVKSLPIEIKNIFIGKLGLGLLVTVPISLVSSFLLSIAFNLSFIQWLILLILIVSMSFLSAVFGLFANILLPKTEFKSPTEVVKQSASVMVATFGGMFLVFIPILVGALLKISNINIYILLVSAVYALITFIMWRFMVTKGVRIFSKL